MQKIYHFNFCWPVALIVLTSCKKQRAVDYEAWSVGQYRPTNRNKSLRRGLWKHGKGARKAYQPAGARSAGAIMDSGVTPGGSSASAPALFPAGFPPAPPPDPSHANPGDEDSDEDDEAEPAAASNDKDVEHPWGQKDMSAFFEHVIAVRQQHPDIPVDPEINRFINRLMKVRFALND